jgi:hypothetical protein
MPRSAILLLCLACAAWSPATATAAEDPAPSISMPKDALADPVGHLVFFAVLEGCYRDGVTNRLVDQLLPENPDTGGVRLEEHFVFACPVCMPAVEALRAYRSRPRFLSDKAGRDSFGKGLAGDLAARLAAPGRAQRLGALEELVSTWVGRRLDEMRLTPDERLTWYAAIAARAAAGQALLKTYRSQDAGEAGGFAELYRDWPEDGCAACRGVMQACKPANRP